MIDAVTNIYKTDDRQEARVRSTARRAGYRVHKSRAQEGLDNFGGYMLIHASSTGVVGGSRFDWSLDDIEARLAEIS
jgi:hypothetical protein